MKIEKFVNLTPSTVRLQTSGGIVSLPPNEGGRIRVEHVREPGHGLIRVDISGAVQLPTAVAEIHPALWDSPRAGGLGVDGLPDPEPGVVILVTGHMAEVAALMGRELDDLFVPLERSRTDRDVTASLCPAYWATPGMQCIIEHVDRRGKPVLKKPGVRGCYTIAGYDVRTVLEVLECFGPREVLKTYERLTPADIGSIERWNDDQITRQRALGAAAAAE